MTIGQIIDYMHSNGNYYDVMIDECGLYSRQPDEIKNKYKNENILIISHGGVCRIINTYFRDMTNEEFFNYTLENGKLEKYEL